MIHHYDRPAPQKFHGKSERIPPGQAAELRRRPGNGTQREFLFADYGEFKAGGLCLLLRIEPANECYAMSTPLEFTPERGHRIEVPAQFGTNQSKVCHPLIAVTGLSELLCEESSASVPFIALGLMFLTTAVA